MAETEFGAGLEWRAASAGRRKGKQMKYSNGRPIGSEEKGKVAGTLHWKVKVEILERHPFNAEILACAH